MCGARGEGKKNAKRRRRKGKNETEKDRKIRRQEDFQRAQRTRLSSCPNSFRIIAAQRHEHRRRRVNKPRGCKCRPARTRRFSKGPRDVPGVQREQQSILSSTEEHLERSTRKISAGPRWYHVFIVNVARRPCNYNPYNRASSWTKAGQDWRRRGKWSVNDMWTRGMGGETRRADCVWRRDRRKGRM